MNDMEKLIEELRVWKRNHYDSDRLECGSKAFDRLVGQIVLETQRLKGWEDNAAQYARNMDYYRGLVVKIGQMFGEKAYISDDGSKQQDVLCAKVPELVEESLSHTPKPKDEGGLKDQIRGVLHTAIGYIDREAWERLKANIDDVLSNYPTPTSQEPLEDLARRKGYTVMEYDDKVGVYKHGSRVFAYDNNNMARLWLEKLADKEEGK